MKRNHLKFNSIINEFMEGTHYKTVSTSEDTINSNHLRKRRGCIKALKSYCSKYCNNYEYKDLVLYSSIKYLDKLLFQKEPLEIENEKKLELLCLCCFIIALKFIGNFDTAKVTIYNFCSIYSDSYKTLELECIKKLDYELIYFTPYDYIQIISKSSNISKTIVNILLKDLDKFVEDNHYIVYHPFIIAISIFSLHQKTFSYKLHEKYLKYYDDYKVNNIIRIIKKMNEVPCEIIIHKKDNLYSRIQNTNNSTKNSIIKKQIIVSAKQSFTNKTYKSNISNNTTTSTTPPNYKISSKPYRRQTINNSTINNTIFSSHKKKTITFMSKNSESILNSKRKSMIASSIKNYSSKTSSQIKNLINNTEGKKSSNKSLLRTSRKVFKKPKIEDYNKIQMTKKKSYNLQKNSTNFIAKRNLDNHEECKTYHTSECSISKLLKEINNKKNKNCIKIMNKEKSNVNENGNKVKDKTHSGEYFETENYNSESSKKLNIKFFKKKIIDSFNSSQKLLK